MECFAQVAHFCRGLGCEDLVAVGGEPGGVAAAAGAHVEDVGAGVWEEVEDWGVDFFEQEVLVIAHQRGRFGVVAGYYVADVEVVVVVVGVGGGGHGN